MEQQKFYVTTPIYYVNDKPHIGHAFTTILADALARYHRLIGLPTYFLTGTDEHGQKVQRAAEEAGITAQEQADRTVVRFQELWTRLEITHDDFIRTTELRHKDVVQKMLQDLYDRDEIYKAEYDGWYCVADERFFTEKDLEEGNCPECSRAVEKIKETNYFFRMSKYQQWLIDYINDHPKFIQPDFRRNETLGFLRKPLTDLCISRPKSRLSWGIDLPFDPDFVTYVWFDALVNYISAVGYLSDDAMFKKWWPASYHLIGKDILTTHTVYWPTMLKAAGVPLPETVFAHGWWLTGDTKMSKSLGNVVNPMDMVEKYGVDAFRYFVMAEMVLGQDASFTEEAFVRRYNSDLANDLGNTLSRVMKLIADHCDGAIPEPGETGEDEQALRETAVAAADVMVTAVEEMRIDRGIAELSAVVRAANRYLEKLRPWVLAKEGEREQLGTALYTAAEALRIVSGMLYPIMPGKMGELRHGLGLPDRAPEFENLRVWGRLEPGTALGESLRLFPRIRVAETKRDAEPGVAKEDAPDGVVRVGFDEFKKVDLRTAEILEAERIDGADKLLRLQVDVGGEKRQIVAGIAKHYAPEDLPGRTIVIVANLEPASIRGVASDGMLLAAIHGKALCLVTVDGAVASGSPVS